MNKSTFEIAASIGSVLAFILMCMTFESGTGFLVSLLVFILIISAAGLKLANIEE